MGDNYELTIRKDMAFYMQLGNNNVEVTGEDLTSAYIKLAGTDAINISTDFIEIEEENKLFLRIRPELEMDGNKTYKLHIPQTWNQDLLFETNNGRISLNNLAGTVKAQTSHGHLSLKNLSGQISVNCAQGAIEAENITGKVDLATTKGKIIVKNSVIEGGSIKSSNGQVALQFTPAPAGSLHVFSGNGEIALAVPETGDYLVRVQTKETLNNHLKDCAVINEKELTTIRMGEGSFTIMVINFKGGVHVMGYQDFGKDWTKQEPWGSTGFKFPDPAKFFQDLFKRDYSKDFPDLMKQIADFSSKFGKIGEELTKKFNQLQKANSRDDEIRIVLEMLQEGKITTEDAERLITAIKRK